MMTDAQDDKTPPSRKGAVAALVVVVALLIGGLALQHRMRADSQMEDCLLSGRKNCAPISTDGK